MASVAVIGMKRYRPAQAPDVARAGLVVDDAGRHEQRRLEGRVVHDVEDRRDHGERAVEPEQQRDQPEVADGRIGQQALQVVLEDARRRRRAAA